MGAYRVTASLDNLDEPFNELASTAEEAAAAAWDFCLQHNLGIPNDSWKVQEWEAFSSAYEESSTYDVMVRGLGSYPPKQDFCHYVVDVLSKKNDAQSRAQTAMVYSAVPGMTPEPSGPNKFEMYRGGRKSDKVTITFDRNAKQSAANPLGRKIDEAIAKADGEDEIHGLVIMLESKLEAAKKKQSEMN